MPRRRAVADAIGMRTERTQSDRIAAEFRVWLSTRLNEMGRRVAEREEALRDYSARLDTLRARHR
jgi:ADP-ribosylglycohydrolase